MSSSKPSLEDLRRQIDEIDDAIHDLLLRRAQVVEQIGAVKDGGPFIRPGREALILRRLAARHTGNLPFPAVARMWREMIAALTRLQGPFAVAVYTPEERRGFWDIARDHYGSTVPMMAVNTAMAAVRAVWEGTAQVGIVPMPEDDDPDPWWRALMSDDAKTPRIVARLPFWGRGNARGDERDAVVLTPAAPEPTGDDRSLLAIELSEDISRGRLKEQFEAAGLPAIGLCTAASRDPSGLSCHLVEIADFLAPRDARLDILADRMGGRLERAVMLGGYAVPLGDPAGH